MIPLDRVARLLRRQTMAPHDLANAFALLAASLLERGEDAMAMVVHEAVTGLREIAASRVAEARRKTA